MSICGSALRTMRWTLLGLYLSLAWENKKDLLGSETMAVDHFLDDRFGIVGGFYRMLSSAWLAAIEGAIPNAAELMCGDDRSTHGFLVSIDFKIAEWRDQTYQINFLSGPLSVFPTPFTACGGSESGKPNMACIALKGLRSDKHDIVLALPSPLPPSLSRPYEKGTLSA